MEIAKQHSFLVLQHANDSSKHTVKIVVSMSAALRDWEESTRISRIFGVSQYRTEKPVNKNFKGNSELIFLGPVHPERIRDSYRIKGKVWLTMGLFNVLIAPSSPDEKKAILQWANKEKINYEVWNIRDGEIIEKKVSARLPRSNNWRNHIADLSDSEIAPELNEALQEYCPLMALSLSRAERLRDEVHPNLYSINRFVIDTLNDFQNGKSIDALYPALGQIMIVNTGLSRFVSQTFSGSTPIIETECHLRSNSLLGIGIPALGLWRLRGFLQNTLGSARLPRRFAMLGKCTTDVPDLNSLRTDSEFWSRDHLGERNPDPSDDKPLIPLLSYFSAREGFKSTLTTISAPLAALYSCNSIQWSLLTITHEISHIVIRSVLSQIYPDLDSSEQISKALELFEGRDNRANLLDEIRRYLLLAITGMDQVASGALDFSDPFDTPSEREEIDEEVLRTLLERWHHEVEELLVHVFDYLYFYGSKADKYVPAIWSSWGTIPNINNRVREYVVRTICASLTNHLHGKDAEELAKDEVYRCLKRLTIRKTSGSYIDRALKYIDKHWADEIKPAVIARKPIVRIAQTFLFSRKLATSIRREARTGRANKTKEGYALRSRHIDLVTISNPLRFIETFTKSKIPSMSESAWMFYILAFCFSDNA